MLLFNYLVVLLTYLSLHLFYKESVYIFIFNGTLQHSDDIKSANSKVVLPINTNKNDNPLLNVKIITIWNNGKIEYEGESLNGKRHGKGKFYYPNGDIYEGEYKDDKKNGQGVFTWSNGNKYDGEWKDNVILDGKGSYSYANDSLKKPMIDEKVEENHYNSSSIVNFCTKLKLK